MCYTHMWMLHCSTAVHWNTANIYIYTYIAQGEHGLLLLISLWRQKTFTVSKYLNCKMILKQFGLFQMLQLYLWYEMFSQI